MIISKKKYHTNKINFKNKSILITGGTGSFGKKIIQTLLSKHQPKKVVIFSRDEFKQYEMEKELKKSALKNCRFFLGDVRDSERLKMAFRDIDIVVHAAALKHVPAAEYNPFECIKTNIIGAQNVVTAAIQTGVKKVIALSTDKAGSPLNLYGASKLASDKIFVAANNLSKKGECSFSVVRYGNVINSRGSVIPLFRDLINSKTSFLPITDKRMTRFWITLEQGVQFVLSCLEYMLGGEIFVPKIPSMKIVDLARWMAPDIPHKFIGIRPGEKIHEVMITQDDARYTIELKDRYIIFPSTQIWSEKFNLNKLYKNNVINLKMDEDFQYSSNSNNQWLNYDNLLNLLG